MLLLLLVIVTACKLSGVDAASTACGIRGVAKSRSSSGGAGAGKISGREAELLTTVANLKAALERVMSCSTPNTQYMQVCRNSQLPYGILSLGNIVVDESSFQCVAHESGLT